jgi:hypothetical protein
MIDLLRFAFGLAIDLVRRRAELVAENALLRQQLIAAQRKILGRVRWAPWQRLTIGVATRFASRWRAAVLLVQPETSFVGIALDFAPFRKNARGESVDRLRNTLLSFERWPTAIHVGTRNEFAASC